MPAPQRKRHLRGCHQAIQLQARLLPRLQAIPKQTTKGDIMTDKTVRIIGRSIQVAVGLLALATMTAAGYYITKDTGLGFFYLALGVINIWNFGRITNALQDF